MAAEQIDALKYALGANAVHGQRGTNADKRRCVEIAVKEFDGLSSRTIAELCAVGDQLVRQVKGEDQVRDSRASFVTGTDGKQYPAAPASHHARGGGGGRVYGGGRESNAGRVFACDYALAKSPFTDLYDMARGGARKSVEPVETLAPVCLY